MPLGFFVGTGIGSYTNSVSWAQKLCSAELMASSPGLCGPTASKPPAAGKSDDEALTSRSAGRGSRSAAQYSVTYDSPSASSLGAMPLGNGRASANAWVEQHTGDLVLNLGLADALDENSNLLKLGLVRVRLQPPLDTSSGFNQTLSLASATVEVRVGGVHLAVWVDAATSTVRISVTVPAGVTVSHLTHKTM